MIEDDLDDILTEAETMDKKKFIEMFRCLDDVYFNKGEEEAMPDVYYDQLKSIYVRRFGELKKIGAPVENKVKLDFHMGSMDKIAINDEKPEQKLERWEKKYPGPYIIEDKLDGVSALLVYYPDGTVSLTTRGDGTHGENKSYLIDYLNLPNLNTSEKIAVRGELIMSKKNFKHYKDKYSNSRNLVAGQINRKKNSINPEILDKIDFVTFEILTPRMKFNEQIKKLEELGFIVVNNTYPVKTITIKKLDKILNKFRDKSDYLMDGIVIYDTSKNYQPTKSGNPKYAFAYKTLAETAEAKVKNVIWTISKHGLLKPKVTLVKSIRLSGVDIKNITAHNAKRVVDNKIGPGTIIEITRSKEVIPHIVRVIKSTKAEMPNMPWKWNSSKVDLIYTGEISEGQDLKRITTFFKQLNAKGISDKTIKRLYENNYKTIHQIILLTKDELENVGFGPKQSQNIYDAIHKSIKKVDLAKLMGASALFGQGLGSKNIQLILNIYPNILTKKINKKMIEELEKIEGFGKKRAEQFVKNLKEFKKFLKENSEITFVTKKIKKSGKFLGKKFVFTGFRDSELQDSIENLGGKIVTTVSKDTMMVIASNPNDKKGKINKAEKLGIKVVSKEEFETKIL